MRRGAGRQRRHLETGVVLRAEDELTQLIPLDGDEVEVEIAEDDDGDQHQADPEVRVLLLQQHLQLHDRRQEHDEEADAARQDDHDVALAKRPDDADEEVRLHQGGERQQRRVRQVAQLLQRLHLFAEPDHQRNDDDGGQVRRYQAVLHPIESVG